MKELDKNKQLVEALKIEQEKKIKALNEERIRDREALEKRINEQEAKLKAEKQERLNYERAINEEKERKLRGC